MARNLEVKKRLLKVLEIKKNTTSAKTLKVAMITALVALGSFIVTYANIFSILYPFGIALFLAILIIGDTRLIIVSSAGAIFGYTLIPNGLLYVITIFGILGLYVLYKTKTSAVSSTLIIICSSILSITARLTFMLAKEPTVYAIIMSVCEGIIISCVSYFFYKAFPIITGKISSKQGVTEREQICVIISLCILLLSMSYINILGASIGRSVAVLITLILSYYGGAALGSMTGAISGLTLSLSGAPQGSYIIGSYAFGGMLAAVFSQMGKVASAVAFVISGSIVTLYINATQGEVISLVEIFIAGITFIIIPSRYTKAFSNIIINNKNRVDTKDKLKEIFLAKLYGASKSFTKISSAISENKTKETIADITDGLVQASENSCKTCDKNGVCWGTYYNDTIDVFNKLCSVYIQKGILLNTDVPKYFTNRCSNVNELVNHLNTSLTQKQQQAKMQNIESQNRQLLADQYSCVGQIIDNIANELDVMVTFDYKTASRINNAIDSLGGVTTAICYTDADGLYSCDINIKWKNIVPELTTITNAVAEICIVPLEIITSTLIDNEQKIKFCEKENLSVISSSASIGKDNKAVCGDSVSTFNAGKGKYVIAISDGMGTGLQASRDSTLTISFLEQLLRAGFPKDSALKLVNSALILKSEDEGFATIDIAFINLVNGNTQLLKAGAAPTFIKHKSNVYKLGCSSLPAGVLSNVTFDKNECVLKNGDIILMVSDGVTTSSEKLISEILHNYNSDNLNDLVKEVLMRALQINDAPDDLTAIAAKIVKNKAS